MYFYFGTMVVWRLFGGNHRKLKGKTTYCVVNNLQMNHSICLKCIPFSIWGKSLQITLLLCPDRLFVFFTPPVLSLPLVWLSSCRNVMTSHQLVSFHLPLSFLTSHKSFFSLFFKQAAAVTSQGFDILLLSHKPESRFLLTSHENSWPGFWMEGLRSTLRFCCPALNVNVPICCPAWPSPMSLSAISGVFDVRGPAELVKLLLDTPSWRCNNKPVLAEHKSTWFPFADILT